mmetsp:Transcript_5108/g.6447  ORF Transcript_5108/g.6447 Transcript_5108/m.6447 type:complete len:128 (-) Transcript_5108:1536-1919(-)
MKKEKNFHSVNVKIKPLKGWESYDDEQRHFIKEVLQGATPHVISHFEMSNEKKRELVSHLSSCVSDVMEILLSQRLPVGTNNMLAYIIYIVFFLRKNLLTPYYFITQVVSSTNVILFIAILQQLYGS